MFALDELGVNYKREKKPTHRHKALLTQERFMCWTEGSYKMKPHNT